MTSLIISSVAFVFFAYVFWVLPRSVKGLKDDSEALIGIEPQAIHIHRRVGEVGPLLIRISIIMFVLSGATFFIVYTIS